MLYGPGRLGSSRPRSDTTYPILYRSRRQKERELKGNYNQISLLNQILVKGEIDHKVQLLGSAKT